MKNIFILGDSYSTYKGYIPEGNAFYYSDERKEEAIVHGVDKTWWRQMAKDMDYNVAMNDSYSGSTVCNTVRPEFTIESSFVSRMDKYIKMDYFAKNNIETVFIFGGTNDSWIDAPIGKLMYSKWKKEDLKSVLPAFCYLIDRIQTTNKDMKIVVILNTDIKPEITDNFAVACEKYGVRYVRLKDIDKASGHPTVLGMTQIASQVVESLK
ncbi:MAG: SGNH/GDSL hydrolase family protein [Eubacteriales bacterium]|nr:SGNH/GDSL hydrolase family protein [Eubacteriales bacterium]